MSYGHQSLALHLRLCAVIRYRGKLTIPEIEEMMPWEFASYIQVFEELSQEIDKEKNE